MEKKEIEIKIKQSLKNMAITLFALIYVVSIFLLSFNNKTFATNELQDVKSLLTSFTDLPYTQSSWNWSDDQYIITYDFNNSINSTINYKKDIFVWFEYVGTNQEKNFFGNYVSDSYGVKLNRTYVVGLSFFKKTPTETETHITSINHRSETTPERFGQLSNNIFLLNMTIKNSTQLLDLSGTITSFGIKFNIYCGFNSIPTSIMNDYVLKIGYADSLYSLLQAYKNSFDLQTVYENAYNQGYDDGFFDGYNQGYAAASTATIEEAYQNGYDIGYQQGLIQGGENAGNTYQQGYNKGYADSLQKNEPIIYNQGYQQGLNVGYTNGLADSSQNPIISMIGGAFSAIGNILDIELLPSITLGAIVLVPVLFGIIAFILGKRKGDD